MSKAFRCDICKNFYEPYNLRVSDGPNSIRYFKEGDNGEKFNCGGYMDCCPECMDAIIKFINSRKPTEDKKDENTSN